VLEANDNDAFDVIAARGGNTLGGKNFDAGVGRVEAAVRKVLADGVRTADIARPGDKVSSCTEMGDAVVAAL